MLDGSVELYEHGEYTLGMFVTGIVNDVEDMAPRKVPLTGYLNWLMVDEWRGTDKRKTRRRNDPTE